MHDRALFRRLTVLTVVEDPQIRQLIRAIFEAEGSTVLEASAGNQALEASDLSAARIHLAVIDASGAEREGIRLARELGAARPDLKILLITGYTQAPCRLPSAGCRVLYKPFSLKALLEKVGDLFAGGPGGQALQAR